MKRLLCRIKKGILGFIPRHISSDVVLFFMEIMRKRQRLATKLFKRYKVPSFVSERIAALEESLASMGFMKRDDAFVEDQNSFAAIRYGKTTMKYAGCEIFAVYNVLKDIFCAEIYTLPRLIFEFEKDGMMHGGLFGTSPRALYDFLKKEGLEAVSSSRQEEYDSIAGSSDALIMTFYNDKDDIAKEIHTVSISKKDNAFTAHNVYCNGMVIGPFDSIRDLIAGINNGKAKPICLIGVKSKKADD